MIEVYVDVAAASVEAGGTEAGNQLAAEPQAVRALRYLAGGSGEPPAELRGAASEVVATVPVRPRGPAWYLTSDIARCQGASARLRTVLIGGTPPTGSVRRCDAVARDLQAAAMEILAAVAMPAGTEDRVTP